jgi:hypothetical protein
MDSVFMLYDIERELTEVFLDSIWFQLIAPKHFFKSLDHKQPFIRPVLFYLEYDDF